MRALFALGAATLTSAEALAQAQPAAPAADPKPWTFQARFEQGGETNLRFVSDGEGGPVERLDASLSRVTRGPKGQLTLSLQGGGRIYPTDRDLDNKRWSAAVNGRRRVSPHVEIYGAGSLLSSYNFETPLLAETGLVAALSETNTRQGSGGFAYAVTSQTALTVEAGYQSLTFSANELVDGSVLSVASTLGHTLSASDTVSLAHGYQRSATSGLTGESHTLSARWLRRLRRLTAEATLGGALVRVDETSAVRPQGGASLSLQTGRATLQAGVNRTVGYAFGFGRQRLVDTYSASYLLPVGQRLQLRAAVLHGRSSDPLDETFRYTNTSASSGFSIVLSPQVTLDGGYTYFRRNNAGPSPASRQSISVAVSYGRSW